MMALRKIRVCGTASSVNSYSLGAHKFEFPKSEAKGPLGKQTEIAV
jgi:hypothetical protein